MAELKSLSEILKETTGIDPTQPHELTVVRLRHLRVLPPTAEVEMYLRTLTGVRRDIDGPQAEKRLRDCQERDAIQATRPDGCWCLGTGESRSKGYIDKREYCPCPEGASREMADIEERSRVWNERDKARRIAVWSNAGIPSRYERFRLDTSPRRTNMTELVAALRYEESPEGDDEAQIDAWRDRYARFQGSWYFWGGYGCGKTGLAIGHAYERVFRDSDFPYRCLFVTAPDLLSDLRSTYGRKDGPTEAEVLAKYTTVGLLVLDDLGAEQVSGSGWLEDRLYQIIGKRHAEERSTIFTSNHNVPQTGARIGERLAWRIVEMCGEENIVHVLGENERDVKGKRHKG